MIRLACLSAILFASHLHASGCAATPEAAVHNAIGAVPHATVTTGSSGYRVQDVHVDLVMHKVWVRVANCDAPGQPPVLVPLNIELAQNVPAPALNESAPAALPQPVQAPAIHAGDAVKVFFASASVQMEVEGTAEAQASVGGMVDVTLKRRGDEPPHRIHGVLRADHRVEVQP